MRELKAARRLVFLRQFTHRHMKPPHASVQIRNTAALRKGQHRMARSKYCEAASECPLAL